MLACDGHRAGKCSVRRRGREADEDPVPHRSVNLVPQPHASEHPTALASLETALAEAHDRLLATMIQLRNPSIGSLAEARQFLGGFLHLVEAAAAGDKGPRDEYLSAVIPGVRAFGFPFDKTLDALVRAALALTAVLEPVHHAWVADFCGDYTRRLSHAWFEGATP
jgi:hypothetical protein